MPVFELEGPDGSTYEVEAPDEASAVSAFKRNSEKTFSGSILPFSRNAAGDVSFDSDAGVVGMAKNVAKSLWSGATAPGDAYSGKMPMWGEDGRTSDEVIARSGELAAMATQVTPGIRSGEKMIPGMATNQLPRAKPLVPSSDDLKDAGSKGYEAVRNMGVDYDVGAVSKLASTARAELERDGINAELAPKTFSILKRLESPPRGPRGEPVGISIDGIETVRRTLKNARKDFNNPTDQLAAARLVGRLDDFVEAPDPGSVVAGAAGAVARGSKEARGNYAAGKRSDQLQGIEQSADLNAAVSNSGQNIDNAIRQRAAAILKDPRKRAGFSKAEVQMIEGVARGKFGRNTLRYVGNLLGGGGGLGAVVTGGIGGAAGGALGGPVGVAAGVGVPVAGMAAKRGGAALTRRALNQTDEAVRMRSPLYQGRLRAAPVMPVKTAEEEAILRSILLSQQGQNR